MKKRGRIHIRAVRLGLPPAARAAAGGLCLLLALRLILMSGAGKIFGGAMRAVGENGSVLRLALTLEAGRPPRRSAPTPRPTPRPTPQRPYPLTPDSVEIGGDAAGEVDAAALFAPPPQRGEKFTVLIIHTHSSEAYAPSENYEYTASDPSRTEDTRFNVVRVGDELESALTEKGFRVIHDRSLYDYPSYSGSYARSCAAVEKYLAANPDIAVVLDLHRDAFTDAGGNVGRTAAVVNGSECARLMLVAGTGSDGLSHPGWRENMRLALCLQAAMDRLYPGLARPLCATGERYNQQLSPGSLILEVGCNGNTLPEALAAVRLFAGAFELAFA